MPQYILTGTQLVNAKLAIERVGMKQDIIASTHGITDEERRAALTLKGEIALTSGTSRVLAFVDGHVVGVHYRYMLDETSRPYMPGHFVVFKSADFAPMGNLLALLLQDIAYLPSPATYEIITTLDPYQVTINDRWSDNPDELGALLHRVFNEYFKGNREFAKQIFKAILHGTHPIGFMGKYQAQQINDICLALSWLLPPEKRHKVSFTTRSTTGCDIATPPSTVNIRFISETDNAIPKSALVYPETGRVTVEFGEHPDFLRIAMMLQQDIPYIVQSLLNIDPLPIVVSSPNNNFTSPDATPSTIISQYEKSMDVHRTPQLDNLPSNLDDKFDSKEITPVAQSDIDQSPATNNQIAQSDVPSFIDIEQDTNPTSSDLLDTETEKLPETPIKTSDNTGSQELSGTELSEIKTKQTPDIAVGQAPPPLGETNDNRYPARDGYQLPSPSTTLTKPLIDEIRRHLSEDTLNIPNTWVNLIRFLKAVEDQKAIPIADKYWLANNLIHYMNERHQVDPTSLLATFSQIDSLNKLYEPVLCEYLRLALEKHGDDYLSGIVNNPRIKNPIRNRYKSLNGEGKTFLAQLKRQLGLD